MSDDAEFAGPPPEPGGQSQGKGVWFRRFACLKERPGEWARWPYRASSAAPSASRLKQGQLGGAAPGELEAVARTVDGATYIYARYVGHVSAVDEEAS